MKNILIIGYGFVGKSVEYSLTSEKYSPFNITIYDPKAGYDVDISNWTDFYAIHIFAFDACIGDNIGHCRSSPSGSLIPPADRSNFTPASSTR